MADYARTHRWLAGAAAVLALLALIVGEPRTARGSLLASDARFVTAIDVARLVRGGGRSVRILDLRADSLFAAYHVPGAESVARAAMSQGTWSSDDVIVVYATDDATAIDVATALELRGVKYVRVLRGGLLSWVDEIVQPRFAPLAPTATAVDKAARREHLELSRYFGGTPYVSPEVGRQPNRGAEAARVARILRRGC